jgi:hypothetical protein
MFAATVPNSNRAAYPLTRSAQNEELGCTCGEAGRRGGLGKRPVAMKKHRINAHPARRIYRKIVRIESGVRQKTFGSCDLIMEGEIGACTCLTPSTLAPLIAGLFLARKEDWERR